ncbi:MAG: thioredoxin family protein [Oceanospirillaceae bacterium]|nr:thioredoxin family protein [Oceanospirillaceae bacterium]
MTMQRFIAIMTLALAPLLATAAPQGNELYSLTYSEESGQEYSFVQHRGEVLLVNFWATWCPPCIREMPALDSLNERFENAPFQVIAISAGEAPEDIAEFRRRIGGNLKLQILLDQSGDSFPRFDLLGLPMSFLYNHEGELVETIAGEKAWDTPEWHERIETLVEAASD